MKINIQTIDEAALRIKAVVKDTPLQFCERLSKQYNTTIYFKREDLQEVRSFKIRGAYNKIASLTSEEKKNPIVSASAGNHAQGVAYSCAKLKIKGIIFMPTTTPNQKIEKVKKFGGKYVDIKLVGNTFDEASQVSKIYTKTHNSIYIHPFDDPLTIAGQGTIGKEIYEKLKEKIDIVICCIGGGGLISGVASYLKNKNYKTLIIGAEPSGAAGMYHSLKNNQVSTLEQIDTFVDGAAVKTVGQLTFKICNQLIEKVVTMPEGKVCQTMVELYQNEGIITEPAGAVSVAALDEISNEIKNKTVVCIISGGNNDILRYPEILERSLVYQGRKCYFIIEFAQKPGQLKNFLNNALGRNDDIVLFEYIKKNNREKGPALVGIELKDKKDYQPLINRMKKIGLYYKIINSDNLLFNYLI